MSPLEIVGGILLVLTSVFMIIVVMMQEHNTTMGGAFGEVDQVSSRNQSKTLNVMLSKATKYAAIVFFVLTLVMNILVVYLK
ncbi:MAG: preprotein translocase subunit SecG [Oscillospiraceae bacterium]